MFEYSSKKRISLKKNPKLNKKTKLLLKGSKNVLDIGCVNGWLFNYLDEGTNYIGISYSENDIKSIKSIGQTAYLVDLDKEPIPIEDGSVDCIYAGHIIEHFEKKELINLMNECKRVLKSKGKIIVTTPTDYSNFFYAEWTHVRPYNHGSLPGLLRDFDFINVDWYYPKISFLNKRLQALLRFPLFFLKSFLWKEIVSTGFKK